ncbi:MAG TPA: hypothetical protein VKB10_05380 [Gaiellaceae bacterium]|nr:hypothetical protein [Gaiellaceae bacterium]
MSALADSVHFEVAELAAAMRLARSLSPRWMVSLEEHGAVSVITAVLRREPHDLALLLRTAEAWVEAESACAIRFEVDGHEYVLHAGGADWRRAPQAHFV